MVTPDYSQLSEDYARIEKAILFIEKNFSRQPSLEEIAQSVYLSEYHFQRLFKRWAGISPKRFLQFLTLEYAKGLLKESKSVLDAAYEAGLSSPARLHDLFITFEGVTPGEFKKNGYGLTIRYGFHFSPFGECLLLVTNRGICGLAFTLNGDRKETLEDLKTNWKDAEFYEDPDETRPLVNHIFAPVRQIEEADPSALRKSASTREIIPPLNLFIRGTNFQVKVWEALLKIPPGSLVSYDDIALLLGKPGASRTVGHAVGQNPISFLIPCHRVIRKVGLVTGYRWGTARKKAILGWEAAKRSGNGMF
jgi:AraC family transcriptional regulator of adaptative response/methylated-DNA-[protein]-cysteine methyltransferase